MRRRLPVTSVVVFSALIVPFARAADTDKLWATLNDPLYAQSLARHPERLAGGVADSGAVSVNHAFELGQRKDFYIEQQRYGGDWMQAAVVTGDDKLMQRARKVIDWGLAREADDGTYPGTGDPLHSTSFFVEAMARSILVTQHVQGALPPWMEAWKGGLRKSADWMADPATTAQYHRQALEPFSHRYFLHAFALAATARVTGDDALRPVAEQYAREGIARLTADGVLPERGGFDVNYQTLSVLYMNRYLLVCDDAGLRQQLVATIKAAGPQLAKRFGPDGIVNNFDSTRTKELNRSGKPKQYDYKNAVQAFLMAAVATNDPTWHELAARIVKGQHWD